MLKLCVDVEVGDVGATRDQYKSVPTPFRFSYPDSYRSEIFLTKFERDSRDYKGNHLGYTFIDAYPSSMISIPVTYGQSDVLRCTVSFTYVRYVRERNSAPPLSDDFWDNSLNLLNRSPEEQQQFTLNDALNKIDYNNLNNLSKHLENPYSNTIPNEYIKEPSQEEKVYQTFCGT